MKSVLTAILGAGLLVTMTVSLAEGTAARQAARDATTAEKVPATTPDADNTGRNERDRSGATQTPPDQSSSEGDVELTRKIRKALTDDATLGTNAHNVKIITVNGQVTLRGPVANADERAKVVAVAKGIADPKQVRDELEVESH